MGPKKLRRHGEWPSIHLATLCCPLSCFSRKGDRAPLILGDSRPESRALLAALLALAVVASCEKATHKRAQGDVFVSTISLPCSNCDTDFSPAGATGTYSLMPDQFGSYIEDGAVHASMFASHGVYTLDTTGTLVNGVVGAATRTVRMHFYSPVEGKYSTNVLPACWNGQHDQQQAVTWSVFSSDATAFTEMERGSSYPGFARLDFAVRNGKCEGEVSRFYLRWSNVCITHPVENAWVVTSSACGILADYGEASLKGVGSDKTLSYGDWRMPFQMTLMLAKQ